MTCSVGIFDQRWGLYNIIDATPRLLRMVGLKISRLPLYIKLTR